MIRSEPLVEVAVRQIRDRARRSILQFRSQAWRSSGLGEEASKRQNLQPWNEAPLPFTGQSSLANPTLKDHKVS